MARPHRSQLADMTTVMAIGGSTAAMGAGAKPKATAASDALALPKDFHAGDGWTQRPRGAEADYGLVLVPALGPSAAPPYSRNRCCSSHPLLAQDAPSHWHLASRLFGVGCWFRPPRASVKHPIRHGMGADENRSISWWVRGGETCCMQIPASSVGTYSVVCMYS